MFFLLVILAAVTIEVDGVCIDTCLVKAVRSGAKQWHDYWTQRKRAKPMKYDEELHRKALQGAKNVLQEKPHGIDTNQFCTYYMILNTPYDHTWQTSHMQRLFNVMHFNNIGYVAQQNPGTSYGCAFHAVFADGTPSEYYGNKKILLCTYRIKNSWDCDPDRRNLDPTKFTDYLKIDFSKE